MSAYGTMAKRGVEIEMYGFDDHPVYPLHLFKKVLKEWVDFLKTGKERILEFDESEYIDYINMDFWKLDED